MSGASHMKSHPSVENKAIMPSRKGPPCHENVAAGVEELQGMASGARLSRALSNGADVSPCWARMKHQWGVRGPS